MAIDAKYVDALNNKANALAKLSEHTNIKYVAYYDSNAVNTLYQYVVVIHKNIASPVPLNYGKYTEAVQYYDAALSIDPNAIDILGNKGIVFIKLGYYAEAIKIFDRILAIDANSVIGLYNKGTCLNKLGQSIQAKKAS